MSDDTVNVGHNLDSRVPTNKIDNGGLGQFEFSQREEGFDNHISNSIQNYDMLWETVVNMSQWFVENNTNMYDLGCSTGKLVKALYDKNKETTPYVNYIGIDCEETFTEKYPSYEKTNYVNLIDGDIRKHNFDNASFVTSIFTLQFTSLKDRADVLRRVYQSLNPGGGFVLAEKTMSESAKLQDVINSLYYQFKMKSFDANDILTKEHKLRYLMKPVTDSEIVDMLETAGFSCYQKFWQSYNFVSYLCIKK